MQTRGCGGDESAVEKEMVSQVSDSNTCTQDCIHTLVFKASSDLMGRRETAVNGDRP